MNPISHSADCKVAPDVACSRILSVDGLHAWWLGKVTVTEHDASWPAVNTRMSWRQGRMGLFSARITEDGRPSRVVMEVVTPSADSRIIHAFDALPGEGTRYTKTVEPRGRSGMSRFMMPLLAFMIRGFVKKEVKRAAAFADLG